MQPDLFTSDAPGTPRKRSRNVRVSSKRTRSGYALYVSVPDQLSLERRQLIAELLRDSRDILDETLQAAVVTTEDCP